jgi:PEP-CTERM motif
MIMKSGLSAIQLACAAAIIGLCQTSTLAGVLVSGGITTTSADDLTTELRFDISADGGSVNTEIFAPPFELPFPNTRVGVVSNVVSGLNFGSGFGSDYGQREFAQVLILNMGGAGVFDAKGIFSSRGTYLNPLGVDAIPTLNLLTRFWSADVTDKNTVEEGEFASAGLDVLFALNGGPKQSIARFGSTLDSLGATTFSSGFDATQLGNTNDFKSATRSFMRVGLPGSSITRDLAVVSGGGSVQLEFDLSAYAIGNFFEGQCDDGTGSLTPCAGGSATLDAGFVPREPNILRISWRAAPQAVPLPSTLLLAGLGLFGLGVFSRRKA